MSVASMSNMWYMSVIMVALHSGVTFGSGFDYNSDSTVSSEILLARHLQHKAKRCGKIARPLYNVSVPLRVQFGIRLIDFEVDGKSSTISISAWLRYKWRAECLQWDPDVFGGIKSLPFPADLLWLPDITLVNTADANRVERQADVLLKRNGDIFWAPHRTYRAACALDLTNYPFDVQRCELWFQSMAKRSTEMQITPYYKSPFDLSTVLVPLKDSSEWDIIGNSSGVIVRPKSSGMIVMYSRRQSVLFSLTLRRRPGFLAYLLMIPCVLLSFMSAIIFCIPPDRPDRNTLGMHLLTCLMLLLLLLVNIAPPTAGSIPRLGLYYGFNLCMSVMAIFLSIFVVNIHYRSCRNEKVPACVKKVLLNGIGRYIFIRKGFIVNRKNMNQQENLPTTCSKEDHLHCQSDQKQCASMMTSLHLDKTNVSDGFVGDLHANELYDIEAQTQMSVHRAKPLNEWVIVGMVLDRIFIILYIIALITGLFNFFPRINQV